MDVKELLSALDISISDEATLDQVKDAIHDKYVSRSIAHEDETVRNKVLGKELNVLERNIKKGLKSAGYELTDDFSLKAFESDDPEVNPLHGLREHYVSQIEKLKQQGTAGNSQKVKELEEQIQKLDRDAKSYKSMLDEKDSEFSQFKEQVETEKKNWFINQTYNESFKKHKLSDTVDEYKLKGFESIIREKYKFDLEDNKVVVYNSDGERVKNSKRSDFATIDEVLATELEAANMLKKNNTANERKFEPRTTAGKTDGSGTPTADNGRQMRANGIAEKYSQRKG